MPTLSRRASDDPSGRARQPVTAISCDPAAAPDITLVTVWRGGEYRVHEHARMNARAVADLLSSLHHQHREAALHINGAGAGRAVLDQLRHRGVPVRPWERRPSKHHWLQHADDALLYAIGTLRAHSAAAATTALSMSMDAISNAITRPVKPPSAPAAPSPRALTDSPWFFVGCAILGMLAGTVVSTTAYFFHHP